MRHTSASRILFQKTPTPVEWLQAQCVVVPIYQYTHSWIPIPCLLRHILTLHMPHCLTCTSTVSPWNGDVVVISTQALLWEVGEICLITRWCLGTGCLTLSFILDLYTADLLELGLSVFPISYRTFLLWYHTTSNIRCVWQILLYSGCTALLVHLIWTLLNYCGSVSLDW